MIASAPGAQRAVPAEDGQVAERDGARSAEPASRWKMCGSSSKPNGLARVERAACAPVDLGNAPGLLAIEIIPDTSGAGLEIGACDMKAKAKAKKPALRKMHRCPTCGVAECDWPGAGVVRKGSAYCCRGCADGRGCTCGPGLYVAMAIRR